MARLRIAVSSDVVGVPIPVEVIDKGLDRIWFEPVVSGQLRDAEDIGIGCYLIQAHLPSGETLKQGCRVDSNDATIDIELAAPGNGLSESCRKGTTLSVFRSIIPAKCGNRFPSECWARLWGCADNEAWSVEPCCIRKVHGHERGHPRQWMVSLPEAKRRKLYCLQVGSPSLPWRVIALPAGDVDVQITSAKALGHGEKSVVVDIRSRNPTALAMSAYLNAGAIGLARVISRATSAEDLLIGKTQDPLAAIVGGYFLLRTGDFERFDAWAKNTAEEMSWLPDRSVIVAWYMLRRPTPDVKGAQELLVRAAARGLPLLTEGVRLLYDGLTLCDQEVELRDAATRCALKTVRRYAMAIDWEACYTTFRGSDPETPSRKPVTGVPADRSSLHFLDQGDDRVPAATNIVSRYIERLGRIGSRSVRQAAWERLVLSGSLAVTVLLSGVLAFRAEPRGTQLASLQQPVVQWQFETSVTRGLPPMWLAGDQPYTLKVRLVSSLQFGWIFQAGADGGYLLSRLRPQPDGTLLGEYTESQGLGDKSGPVLFITVLADRELPELGDVLPDGRPPRAAWLSREVIRQLQETANDRELVKEIETILRIAIPRETKLQLDIQRVMDMGT